MRGHLHGEICEDARFFALVELSHLGVKIKLVICSRERSGAMRLKKTTEKSSDQLRGIATAVFVVGLIIGVTLITLGMMSIIQAKEQDGFVR